MGSPYTTIHTIPVDRFREFDERLKVVEAERTLAAWGSFFEHFDVSPIWPLETLVEQDAIGDGTEPHWFHEWLVNTLVSVLTEGCRSFQTEPNLIEDMWYRNYKLINLCHEVCASSEDQLQACLLRLLLLDKYMRGVAMWNARGRLPASLLFKAKWIVNDPKRKGRPGPPAAGDKIDREVAARVAFEYRYPCCLLCSSADESILSPDQVEQLARASKKGGILERFRQALPEEDDVEDDDLDGIARFLRRLSKPYPYLYSIASGT
jgi:hypothetical protein